MEDSQQGKGSGRTNELWNTQETKKLVELFLEGINNGWRDASGCMSKKTVEKFFLPVQNKDLRCEKTYKHYNSTMRNLKIRYNSMQDVMKFSSGFGWDSKTKKIKAEDRLWDEYEKVNSLRKNMRNEVFKDYENLQLLFNTGVATGKNVVGLGDDTDAQTFGAKDNSPCELYIRLFESVGTVDGSQVSGSLDSPMPQTKEAPLGKLPVKKRAKSGEYGGSSNSSFDGNRIEKIFNEMIGVTNQVVSLIQQREERQQREASSRDAEKRKNNIWEAIKEVPGLEENVRYDTLNEIHRLGLKDVFISMSIEERNGWIWRNMTN